MYVMLAVLYYMDSNRRYIIQNCERSFLLYGLLWKALSTLFLWESECLHGTKIEQMRSDEQDSPVIVLYHTSGVIHSLINSV